jgi:hypothetical protein
MSSDTRTRLVDAGWTLTCERHIEIDTRGDCRHEQRYFTWRATKGTFEVVVQSNWGHDQPALVDLYKAAKAIDPDLQRLAMEAGSGAWIIDPKELESQIQLSE